MQRQRRARKRWENGKQKKYRRGGGRGLWKSHLGRQWIAMEPGLGQNSKGRASEGGEKHSGHTGNTVYVGEKTANTVKIGWGGTAPLMLD